MPFFTIIQVPHFCNNPKTEYLHRHKRVMSVSAGIQFNIKKEFLYYGSDMPNQRYLTDFFLNHICGEICMSSGLVQKCGNFRLRHILYLSPVERSAASHFLSLPHE